MPRGGADRGSSSPSPLFIPHSPKCLVGVFSEVRQCAQSSLACSSGFTPQCAGGLRSGGSRVFSSPVAGSNSSWVRLAVERSAPERFAPERSVSERSAWERSASERFVPRSSALARFASERSDPLHEFQVTVATSMASWVTPFLGCSLTTSYILPTTSVGEAKPSVRSPGVWGDFVVYYPRLSTRASTRWGDYNTCRRSGSNPAEWVAGGYVLDTGSAVPHFIRFSR